MVEFIQSQDLDTVIRLSDVRKVEVEGYRSMSLAEQVKSMFNGGPAEYDSYDVVVYMNDNDENESYIMANYVQKADAQKAVSNLFNKSAFGLSFLQSNFFKFPEDMSELKLVDTSKHTTEADTTDGVAND